jgi:hypothetical protein
VLCVAEEAKLEACVTVDEAKRRLVCGRRSQTEA